MTIPTDDDLKLLQQAQVMKLQGEIAALQSAIISGETRVSYDGKSVDYDDLAGMKMRLNFANNTLNALMASITGTSPQRKAQAGRALFSNGYRTRPIIGGGNFGGPY